MEHTHLPKSLLLAVWRGAVDAQELLPVLLERLGEICPDCAAAIDAARESFETEAGADFYAAVVGAGLEQVREHLATDDSPKVPAQVDKLRGLNLEQRALWIRNNPDAWDDVRLGETVFSLAQAALPTDPGASLGWALTAREIARIYSEPWPAHSVLADAYEGNAHRVLGDYPRARKLLGDALNDLEAQEIADPQVIASVHSLVASLSFDDGDLSGAAAHSETAANHFMQGQDSEGMVRETLKLARVYDAKGDHVAAIQADRRALTALDENHPLYLLARINLALHLETSGAYQEARDLLEYDREALQTLPASLRSRVTWLQARLAIDEGDFATAELLFETTRKQLARTRNLHRFAHASLELARLYHRQSRPEDVARIAAEALEIFRVTRQARDARAALKLIRNARHGERPLSGGTHSSK